MESDRSFVHVPGVDKLVILHPTALDNEAREVSNLLVQIFKKLLGDFSSFEIEGGSCLAGTLFTSCWRPGTWLSSVQQPLPSP